MDQKPDQAATFSAIGEVSFSSLCWSVMIRQELV